MALSAAQLETEWAVRRALVPYLEQLQQRYPDAVPRQVLIQRVQLAGMPVNLMDPARGISKPSALAAALSVMTAPPRPGQPPPYEDRWISEDRLSYAYQGTDPSLYTNRALQVAWEHRLPLVYFYGVRPGEFLAEFPVYVERDRPEDLRVDMVFADPIGAPGAMGIELDERRYSTRTTRSRLHQLGFRLRVLQAYEDRCAICRLGRPPLLDAAHIVPDTEPLGLPVTSNGLSLCKLHHSAYDKLLIGVTPALRVEVATDVLEEQDGPMLRHGLQELQGQELRVIPGRRVDRPKRELLEWRYERFRQVAGGA